MRLAIILAFLLALPGTATSQAGQGLPAQDRVGSAAALIMKAGKLADANRVFLGGLAGLVFGERFFVGGGGVGITERVELPGSESGTGFDLGLGYGGIYLKYWDDLAMDLTGEASLLVGAGRAQVTDLLGNLEAGSDNFMVLEPEVSVFYSLYRKVFLGASGGYRLVWGVEDLPRVSAGDLRSFTLTLSLRLGGR